MKTKLISATLGALLLTGSTIALADRDNNHRGDFRGRDHAVDVRGGHDERNFRNTHGSRDDWGRHDWGRRDWGRHPHYRPYAKPQWHGYRHPHWDRGYRHGYYQNYAPHRYYDRDGVTIIFRSTIR